eukprot:jgi/Tetstr1/440932/TSEL_029201.t1
MSLCPEMGQAGRLGWCAGCGRMLEGLVASEASLVAYLVEPALHAAVGAGRQLAWGGQQSGADRGLLLQLVECKRIDDRMHGRCKLPFNTSFIAMVNKAVKAPEEEHGDLEEAGINIPSRALVELQFCPKNIFATRALAIHMSVQLGLMILLLEGGMDTMLMASSAPRHSRANHAERVMGKINLVLQCIALARMQMATPPPPDVAAADAIPPRSHWLADCTGTPSPAPGQAPARADSASSSAESVNKDEDDPDFDNHATAAGPPNDQEGDTVMGDE